MNLDTHKSDALGARATTLKGITSLLNECSDGRKTRHNEVKSTVTRHLKKLVSLGYATFSEDTYYIHGTKQRYRVVNVSGDNGVITSSLELNEQAIIYTLMLLLRYPVAMRIINNLIIDIEGDKSLNIYEAIRITKC